MKIHKVTEYEIGFNNGKEIKMSNKYEMLKQFHSLYSKFKTSRDELIQLAKEYNIDCLHCKYKYNTEQENCKRRFIHLNQDTLIPLCFEFTDN